MEGCNSIDPSRPGEEWVLQHLFLGTPKRQQPQTHPEFEVLQLIVLQNFILQSIRAVRVVMRPHQWMLSIDLKDAYFHIRLVTVHHQFLRFSWQDTS